MKDSQFTAFIKVDLKILACLELNFDNILVFEKFTWTLSGLYADHIERHKAIK